MPTFLTIVFAILTSAAIWVGTRKLVLLCGERLKRQRKQRALIERRRRTVEAYRRGFLPFVVVEREPLISRSYDY